MDKMPDGKSVTERYLYAATHDSSKHPGRRSIWTVEHGKGSNCIMVRHAGDEVPENPQTQLDEIGLVLASFVGQRQVCKSGRHERYLLSKMKGITKSSSSSSYQPERIF